MEKCIIYPVESEKVNFLLLTSNKILNLHIIKSGVFKLFLCSFKEFRVEILTVFQGYISCGRINRSIWFSFDTLFVHGCVILCNGIVKQGCGRNPWSAAQSLHCAFIGLLRTLSSCGSEDSDQIEWMPRLICVFAGRTIILLVLSWGGSFVS